MIQKGEAQNIFSYYHDSCTLSGALSGMTYEYVSLPRGDDLAPCQAGTHAALIPQ